MNSFVEIVVAKSKNLKPVVCCGSFFMWCKNLIMTGSKKLFSIFRFSHNNYLDLAYDYSNDTMLNQSMCDDYTSKKSNYVKMILLRTLRYLGRGWTLDNVEEVSCISREIHRQFFNVFIERGHDVLCDGHTALPAMSTDASVFEELFNIMRMMLNFHVCRKNLVWDFVCL